VLGSGLTRLAILTGVYTTNNGILYGILQILYEKKTARWIFKVSQLRFPEH